MPSLFLIDLSGDWRQMASAGKARRALWLETFLALFPFLIYLISFLGFIPRSLEKWDSTVFPHIFYYLSLFYILGTLLFALFKQFHRDSFYVWLSFSIYFSLSTIIGEFNPFHLSNDFSVVLSMDRAWIVALASLFLMFLLRRTLGTSPNRLIYPVVVFFFCLSHNMIYMMDLLSFGGVHVDAYDPFPWIRRIMIPTLLIFILSIIVLSTLKRRSLRLILLILLFLAHAMAWNQSRFSSIQNYTHTLALIRGAGAYITTILLSHFRLFFLKSGLFLFLLLLIPDKKKPASM